MKILSKFKIERVLVDHEWLEGVADSEAQFLPEGVPDHSPVVT